MPFARDEKWGSIIYDSEADCFRAEPRNPGEGFRSERPLSLTCYPGEADLGNAEDGLLLGAERDPNFEEWLSILRRLRSWGVLRLNIGSAEVLERAAMQWFLDEAGKLDLKIVFSIENVPPNLELQVPPGAEVRIPIEPANGRKHLELLARCIASRIEVRILTVFEPLQAELLRELGSDLALLDIRDWTIAPPPSSAEQVWIEAAPGGIPQEVLSLRERFSWLRIDYADIAARENNLIVLSDGAVFTQDPVTRERLWLGWLKELELQELIAHSKFSLERHLNLWVNWAACITRAGVITSHWSQRLFCIDLRNRGFP